MDFMNENDMAKYVAKKFGIDKDKAYNFIIVLEERVWRNIPYKEVGIKLVNYPFKYLYDLYVACGFLEE